LVRLDAGQRLCGQGACGDALFVLLEGELERRRERGRRIERSPVRGLTTLDEVAALEGGPHPWTLVATSPARLWRVPRTALLSAFEEEPSAARGLVVQLSTRLRQANEALERRPGSGLSAPLAAFLLSSRNRRDVVPMTQTAIAQQLTASREKVNRKLNAWAREGWVELGRAGVRVHDRRALQRLLGMEDD
jgi:CRP/FNR family transcriptional regulator